MAAAAAAAVGGLVAALKQCSGSGDLEGGRKLHLQAAECGLVSNRYVVSSLINMYAKCGSMVEAHKVFDAAIASVDVTCWTALILGYSNSGESRISLQLFETMIEEHGIKPDPKCFVTALGACHCLGRGRELHTRVLRQDCSDVYLENALIAMYTRSPGRMVDARMVFDGMVKPDVVSWTCLLQGYVDNGESELGVALFDTMLVLSCGGFKEGKSSTLRPSPAAA